MEAVTGFQVKGGSVEWGNRLTVRTWKILQYFGFRCRVLEVEWGSGALRAWSEVATNILDAFLCLSTPRGVKFHEAFRTCAEWKCRDPTRTGFRVPISGLKDTECARILMARHCSLRV